MKKALHSLLKRIDPILAVAAIGLVTAGVAMYSRRAGLIVAGVLIWVDVYVPRLRGKNGRNS